MDAFEIIQKKIKALPPSSGQPLIIGISGGQGSGKSYVSQKLKDEFGDDCAVIGLDDFYLTHQERHKLSEQVSPLLKTRGVPGTHDIEFFLQCLDDLKNHKTNYPVSLPLFDKLADDRSADRQNIITQAPSIILIEGWCVGAMASPDFMMDDPLNDVEKQDHDHQWRSYQHDYLCNSYQDLWAQIDHFFYMVPSDFKTIETWRLQQLAHDKNINVVELSDEDRAWVHNFIQYYERITTGIINGHHCSGTVLKLSDDRTVRAIEERGR